MGNNSMKESLDSVFTNLEKFIKTETVIGEPIVVGEVTLVPIISVMFGCGAGGGTGGDNKGMTGDGSGGGGGARISPNAILVIKKDEVIGSPITYFRCLTKQLKCTHYDRFFDFMLLEEVQNTLVSLLV